MVKYIAGDIGGTNSRLQLREFDPKATRDALIGEETYPSQSHASMEEILFKFVKKYNKSQDSIHACVLAVAGPVEDNSSKITNLSWIISGSEISKHLHIPHVTILNDFAGIGYGLLALKESDMTVIQKAKVVPGAPKAVIGAGTGLGQALLAHDGFNYNVLPTEGGHSDFAPRNMIEYELMKYNKETHGIGRVSVERVVSGSGLPTTYAFFKSKYPDLVNKEVDEQINVAKNEDKGRIITDAAKDGKCAVCEKVVQLFIECYGGESGNLCLKSLPFGGLYIAGGIAAKIPWALSANNNQYVRNFLDKGRMREVLQKVPIYLVNNPQVGLLGAQVVAQRIISSHATPRSKL